VASLILFGDFFQRSPLTPAWIVSLLSLLVAGVVPAIFAEIIIILATLYFTLGPGRSELVAPGDGLRIGIWIACIGLADLIAWRLQRARSVSAARERALGESETRYRDLLEQASDGIVLLEPDGRFALANQRAADMLGYSEAELLQLRFPEVYANGAGELPPPSWDDLTGGVALEERWLRRKDGTALEAELSLRLTGRGLLQVIIRDITERRRLEEARRSTEKRLQSELLQAQKMESLGRLAGGVAHDFNNLLTIIRGYADVLAGQVGDEDPRLEEIKEIRHAADRGASLTRQLLALSRRQMLVVRDVDLNTLVTDLERMLRRVLGTHIEIVTLTAPELGWVRADPGQLEQVLLNLAVNARDAMPRGGTLRIETDRVVVRRRSSDWSVRGVSPGDYVMLRVSDTGVGMDIDTQLKAFEPFFTTKQPGEGTGLGLSTVYGIVQQFGGAITLESLPGRGTTFRLFFPRIEQPEEAGWEDQPAPPRRRKYSRGTVLVVEDEERVRRLTCRILESCGFGVVEAADGQTALDLLHGGETPVDALVSDVVMPGMSGPDLVARARRQRPDLPVLLLSGFTADEVSTAGESPGDPHRAFLQKPFTPDALAIAVEELLSGGAVAG
jgi:PAS domain S-box-containing protein